MDETESFGVLGEHTWLQMQGVQGSTKFHNQRNRRREKGRIDRTRHANVGTIERPDPTSRGNVNL